MFCVPHDSGFYFHSRALALTIRRVGKAFIAITFHLHLSSTPSIIVNRSAYAKAAIIRVITTEIQRILENTRKINKPSGTWKIIRNVNIIKDLCRFSEHDVMKKFAFFSRFGQCRGWSNFLLVVMMMEK